MPTHLGVVSNLAAKRDCCDGGNPQPTTNFHVTENDRHQPQDWYKVASIIIHYIGWWPVRPWNSMSSTTSKITQLPSGENRHYSTLPEVVLFLTLLLTTVMKIWEIDKFQRWHSSRMTFLSVTYVMTVQFWYWWVGFFSERVPKWGYLSTPVLTSAHAWLSLLQLNILSLHPYHLHQY